jgi:MOSC domain-containing protein YiiM
MSISAPDLPFGIGSRDRSGVVGAIYVAPWQGAPMVSVERALAVPGRGLEGDRYFLRRGRFAGRGRDLTLVEGECLTELRDELAIDLDASETRRNLLVWGLQLIDLVGAEFHVGSVRVRGEEVCEPCAHLEPVRRDPRVLKGLVRRGGLRASILTRGEIVLGDAILA